MTESSTSSQAFRSSSAAPAMTPLFVDLDGTLITTDCMAESLIGVVRKSPRRVPEVVRAWRAEGRPELKRLAAEISGLDVATLPYRPETLDLIRQAREAGRPVVLASASHRDVVRAVADHLGLFDDVLASADGVNLKSEKKLAAIRAWCAERGYERFAYAGDAHADLAVWPGCHEVIAVAPSGRLKQAMAREGLRPRVIGDGRLRWSEVWKLIRPYQWSKNVLVFLPAVIAHDFMDWDVLLAVTVAFVAMSLLASAVYVVNDLLDVEADRHHRSKKERPFAAGTVPLAAGSWIAGLLGVLGLGLAVAFLPWAAVGALLTYLVLTHLYSFWLKRKPMVDVLVLASLYTLRVLVGAWSFDHEPSKWLLAFSMFFFLSLAFAKRYTEVLRLENDADADVSGRGYKRPDIALIRAMGPSTGFLSVLVLAMFIADASPIWYQRPSLLYLNCVLLLYWVARVWLIAHRDELHDDPLVFALRDMTSRMVGLGALVIFVLASGA
ncbi:UbiA family prenyltransferase [Mucisphaera sp.]|uniref:UbiA family prenyltransferase n=1 Tax=Mucisphaera sp. TaxID=2913024 RepID=UPI003D12EE8E